MQIKTIKTFKCPNCGSIETVSQLAIKESKLVEKGLLKADVPSALRRNIIPLVEASRVALTVPAVATHFDVCADCGTEYCTRAEVAELPIQYVQPGQPQGIPFPPRKA